MDLSTAGTFLQGAGSLFGSVFGGPSKPSPGASGAMQKALSRGAVVGAAKGAKKAGEEYGFHPLALLGASANYTPTASNGANIGAGMEAAGRALSQLGQSREQKELLKKEGALLDAQVAEARSRTLLNIHNAKRPFSGPSNSVSRDPFARRKENALIEVKLENGEVVTVPNPDIYEISPTELATGRAVIELARQVERQAKEDKPKPSIIVNNEGNSPGKYFDPFRGHYD